jgi:hypothetical protein
MLLKEDLDKFGKDTTRINRENKWLKNVTKDIYIHEATNILNDLK